MSVTTASVDEIAEPGVAAFLDGAGLELLALSTRWCVPCRLLTPLPPKLAADLAIATARFDAV